MSKTTQRWEWAIGLKLEELNDKHLQAAYKLNWDNLCKFDSCRKNCKRILCLACFDRTWIENESANTSGYDNYDTTNCEQERTDLKSFVGLKNLGATCYVNCLLQLWFHNPALRKAIYEWDKNAKNLDSIKQNDDNNHNKIKNNHKILPIEASSPATVNKQEQPQTQTKASKRLRDDEKLQLSPAKKMNKPLNERNNSTQSTNSSPPNQNDQKTSNSAIVPYNEKNDQQPQQKPKNPVQTNPIEQLQLIFARLQFTNKKSIDPFNFIDSLALNAAEQQDAQEFGNLFMEFLEKSFASQNNSFVSKIIQNQFCGRYSYATICDHCKHSSLSDSNFYELDLSIQNLETLHDCLNEFFRPVELDGKYNCSRCQKAQSAHRKIILKSLPPTLNLQLLRFVYDVQRNTRQKLNSYIVFPEILDMSPYLKEISKSSSTLDLCIKSNNNSYLSYNGNSSLRSHQNHMKSNIYILSAVLIHRGSSPHSGHYIAHIKDRITKDWYKFNDDSVERIGPQLQVSSDGENITIVEDKTETIKIADPNTSKVTRLESKSLKSKTAYMLVYQAQDNEALTYPSDHSEEWQLPEHLQTAVAEENSKSEELFESLQIAKEVDQQIIIARKIQIKTIYEKLVCRDPTDKFEFMDKAWLQRWLTNSSTSAKFPPIDNSEFLCIHDKLDFRKLDQVKCVRTEGADMLYKEFGGGPRLQDAMCRDCVELEVKLIQLKDRMKEDQKYITSQAKFKIGANYDFADAYIVGKNSYRDWQALVMVQFEKSYPELLSRERNSSNCQQQNSSDEDDQQKSSTNFSKDTGDSTQNNNGSNNEDAQTNSNSESDDEAMERFVFNSDVLCEHNQLINDPTAWRIVPKEVWLIFKSYFNNDPTRPLIERNANTLMCAECKKQEVEMQEIGDIQKQKASEQKAKLPDLFHNKKRASWCSMLPNDVFYALDRQFLIKWQKFIRNPCNQEQPTSIKNAEKLICDHGKSLYNFSNSNPILPECPFVLVNNYELKTLKQFYPVDSEIKFTVDSELAEEKLKLYLAKQKLTSGKKSSPLTTTDCPLLTIKSQQLDNSGDNNNRSQSTSDDNQACNLKSIVKKQITDNLPLEQSNLDELTVNELTVNLQNVDTKVEVPDLAEIDWSDCVKSEPDFCSDCFEMLKRDELKKLLNYDSATIYITKVENPCTFGPQNKPDSNGGNATSTTNDNCDTCETTSNQQVSNSASMGKHVVNNSNPTTEASSSTSPSSSKGVTSSEMIDIATNEEQYPFKRRKRQDLEDEGNDFVPPGVLSKQPVQSNQTSNSILRRTTRRNRNREQAYTIKPTQTLLQLKKEIFSRCQVLPVDQRLFLNDVLLDDNSKTMSELRIVPNCSLKLEVSNFTLK